MLVSVQYILDVSPCIVLSQDNIEVSLDQLIEFFFICNLKSESPKNEETIPRISHYALSTFNFVSHFCILKKQFIIKFYTYRQYIGSALMRDKRKF